MLVFRGGRFFLPEISHKNPSTSKVPTVGFHLRLEKTAIGNAIEVTHVSGQKDFQGLRLSKQGIIMLNVWPVYLHLGRGKCTRNALMTIVLLGKGLVLRGLTHLQKYR